MRSRRAPHPRQGNHPGNPSTSALGGKWGTTSTQGKVEGPDAFQVLLISGNERACRIKSRGLVGKLQLRLSWEHLEDGNIVACSDGWDVSERQPVLIDLLLGARLE